MGYAFIDTVTLQRVQRLHDIRLYVDEIPVDRHILLLAYYFSLILFLIFCYPGIVLVRYKKHRRIVICSLMSLLLLVELELAKRILLNYVAPRFDIQRDTLNNLFRLLVSSPLVIIALTLPLMGGTSTQSILERRTDLRDPLDVLVGIYCWLWVPDFIMSFSRWMVG